jgi:hypothetical protein
MVAFIDIYSGLSATIESLVLSLSRAVDCLCLLAYLRLLDYNNVQFTAIM